MRAVNGEDHKQALPPGHQLSRYLLIDVLGVGGFGVTYLAEHFVLGHQVAIKEYLPNEFAVRDGTTVHPKSTVDREDFEWGLSRFLDEAQMLTRFRHPNLVRVADCFEANNTVYIVMDYEDGEPLDVLLKRHGTLTEAQLRRVLLPVADGLRQVHAAGFLHRDIKPSNIFVRRSDESPVLLDFGSARQALGRKSKSMTAIASAGYSPPEQYESDSEQGSWTDIYALSALCYRAIVGRVPVEAPRRQNQMRRSQTDPLPSLAETAGPGYSAALIEAVDSGLRLTEVERPQNIDEWLARVEDTPAANRLRASQSPAGSRDQRPPGLDRGQSPPPTPEAPAAMPLFSRISKWVWSGIRGILGTHTPPDTVQTGGSWSKPRSQSPAPVRGRLLGPMEYLRRFLEYLRRLVTGGLGLGRTFWLFGVAGSGVLGFGLAVLFLDARDMAQHNLDLDDGVWAAVLIAPSSVAARTGLGELKSSYIDDEVVVWAATLLIWSLAVKAGIWRAASAYNGPSGWAVLAKLHVFADALLTALVYLVA